MEESSQVPDSSASEPHSSPWDGAVPEYKHVPPLNPKTQEPVKLYLCKLCGGAVLNRNLHTEAHRLGRTV